MPNPSRRFVVAALSALALSGTPALAQAQTFSRIVVDVRPLLDKGLGSYAEFIRRALTVETERVFADRIAPGGPTLVVRIDSISLNASGGVPAGTGSSSRGGGGMFENDYLNGEALIVGRRGEILAAYPQLSALPAGPDGFYGVSPEARRTAALAQHYAWWLRRTIPGV